MKSQANTLKKQLDTITADTVKEYQNIFICDESHEIIQKYLQNKDIKLAENFGHFCSQKNVPYIELSFFAEDILRANNLEFDDVLNHLAKGYLEIRLQDDKKLFEIEMNKTFVLAPDKQRDIINVHYKWILEYIQALTEKTKSPQMDERKCSFGSWLHNNEDNSDFQQLNTLHHNLHLLAEHAFRRYANKEFHRFFLLYIDIIHLSSLLHQALLQHFTHEEFYSLNTDSLTKLPNRFALIHDIKSLDAKTTLFLFNIKDFAKVNLLFGQDSGDKVLKNIASLLSKIADIKKVYRIYGDEFGVLVDTKDAYGTILKIIDILENKPYPEEKRLVNISIYGAYAKASKHLLEQVEFGIIHGRQELDKLTNADTINRKEIEDYAINLQLSQRLQLAFADNRLCTYYQPIYNLKTSKIEKYEVLLRFKETDGTVLPPALFLDVLKNMYIYPDVTKMIVLRAFEKFKNNSYAFSMNLSFRDIVNEETTKAILSILDTYPEVAKRATFELLEYEAVLNFDKVTKFFSLIKGHGAKISLDDFGSGYSNFANIFRLDVDYIKLDGSIIQDVLVSDKAKVLITSIIQIANSIDAKTIAEFVSSEKIFEAVKLLGVDYIQGYFIGEPKPELLII